MFPGPIIPRLLPISTYTQPLIPPASRHFKQHHHEKVGHIALTTLSSHTPIHFHAKKNCLHIPTSPRPSCISCYVFVIATPTTSSNPTHAVSINDDPPSILLAHTCPPSPPYTHSVLQSCTSRAS